MSSDKEIIQELRQEIIELKSIIAQLLLEIKDLKHPKNSKNSSVAPSKDENLVLKNQSLPQLPRESFRVVLQFKILKNTNTT